MNTATIVQKLRNYCNVLRDDGMSYGDYPSTLLRAGSEQFTYLLFLTMADERSRPPYSQPSPVPAGYDWAGLTKKDGDELFDHYRPTLEALGKQKGLLGLIFTKSQKSLIRAAFWWRSPCGRLSASNLQWRLSGPGQAAAADRGPDRKRSFSAG